MAKPNFPSLAGSVVVEITTPSGKSIRSIAGREMDLFRVDPFAWELGFCCPNDCGDLLFTLTVKMDPGREPLYVFEAGPSQNLMYLDCSLGVVQDDATSGHASRLASAGVRT